MENLPVSQSYVQIYLNSKGRYYWTIRLNVTAGKKTISDIEELDKELRNKFPRNSSETPHGTSRFTKIDSFDSEGEDD